MRRVATGLLLGVLVPGVVHAREPAGSADPAPTAEPAPVGELSEQGARRGAVEIGLGVVLTGAAAGLIAFGAVQLIRARKHVEFCNQGVTYIDEIQGNGGGIDPCTFDPPALGFASAGLSWGFSIPMLVGGGMLFARAHRVRADARAWEAMQVAVSPWWGRDGGGASVGFRF